MILLLNVLLFSFVFLKSSLLSDVFNLFLNLDDKSVLVNLIVEDLIKGVVLLINVCLLL